MSTPRTAAQRFVRAVVVLSLLGGLANVLGGAALPDESQAIRSNPSGSLGVLLANEQQFVRERYQLYGQLRDLAAGGGIVVPRDVLDRATLEYLSDLDVDRALDRRRVPEAVLNRLPDAIRYRGITEPTVGSTDDVDYVIATADAEPRRLVTYVTRRSATIVILDEMLATELGLP